MQSASNDFGKGSSQGRSPTDLSGLNSSNMLSLRQQLEALKELTRLVKEEQQLSDVMASSPSSDFDLRLSKIHESKQHLADKLIQSGSLKTSLYSVGDADKARSKAAIWVDHHENKAGVSHPSETERSEMVKSGLSSRSVGNRTSRISIGNLLQSSQAPLEQLRAGSLLSQAGALNFRRTTQTEGCEPSLDLKIGESLLGSLAPSNPRSASQGAPSPKNSLGFKLESVPPTCKPKQSPLDFDMNGPAPYQGCPPAAAPKNLKVDIPEPKPKKWTQSQNSHSKAPPSHFGHPTVTKWTLRTSLSDFKGSRPDPIEVPAPNRDLLLSQNGHSSTLDPKFLLSQTRPGGQSEISKRLSKERAALAEQEKSSGSSLSHPEVKIRFRNLPREPRKSDSQNSSATESDSQLSTNSFAPNIFHTKASETSSQQQTVPTPSFGLSQFSSLASHEPRPLVQPSANRTNSNSISRFSFLKENVKRFVHPAGKENFTSPVPPTVRTYYLASKSLSRDKTEASTSSSRALRQSPVGKIDKFVAPTSQSTTAGIPSFTYVLNGVGPNQQAAMEEYGM